MAFNLSSVKSSKKDSPFRMILTGQEKTGKSTFASQAPAPIFIQVKGEQGIDALDVPTFPVADTFADVLEAIGSLATEDHEFKTVIIDSISALEPMIFKSVCKRCGWKNIEDPGYGKGYKQASKEWEDLINGLDYLRDTKAMNIILIGHVSIKTFADPMAGSFDRYRLAVQQETEETLIRWADITLFGRIQAYVKSDDKRAVGNGERILCTQKRPSHPGGGRGIYGHLPYEIPFSWDEFEAAVKEAK